MFKQSNVHYEIKAIKSNQTKRIVLDYRNKVYLKRKLKKCVTITTYLRTTHQLIFTWYVCYGSVLDDWLIESFIFFSVDCYLCAINERWTNKRTCGNLVIQCVQSHDLRLDIDYVFVLLTCLVSWWCDEMLMSFMRRNFLFEIYFPITAMKTK